MGARGHTPQRDHWPHLTTARAPRLGPVNRHQGPGDTERPANPWGGRAERSRACWPWCRALEAELLFYGRPGGAYDVVVRAVRTGNAVKHCGGLILDLQSAEGAPEHPQPARMTLPC